ncbi:MAG: hypothetical protein WCW52_00715 [Elusimicrobiales bacterium]
MSFILEVILGAASGASAGLAAGCLYSWPEVSHSYTGLRTVWPDCGPYIFIPLWIGTVIGLVARMERNSSFGALATILCGATAGIITPTMFWLSFGLKLYFYFGFLSIPIMREIILGAGGGMAGFFWYMGISRVLH